jgi:tight adherence protein C
LFLLNAIPNIFSSNAKSLMKQRVVLIYGTRFSAFYVEIHLAFRIFYGILGLLVTCFLCMTAETGLVGIFVIPLGGFGFVCLSDQALKKKVQERRYTMERDFPDFICKITLLVNAGMHIRQAIALVVKRNGAATPFYQEMHTVLFDIENGLSDAQAYNELAERCKIKEISNFTGVLTQNLRLGGSQMVFELKRMSMESWETRRNTAKRLGEEASSKLVFPLALMFIAVLLISVAPAMISLNLTM